MSAGASSSRSGAAAAAAAGGSLSSRMQSLSVAGAVAPSALDSLSGVHGLRLPGLPGLGGGGGGDVDEDREGHMAERRKIRAAFSLFDRDGKKVVPKEEVGTIMRYLGAYPSEEELTADILPALGDDEESGAAGAGAGAAALAGGGTGAGVVRLERFESLMLRVMLDRMYEPDSEELVLQAFKVLDPENRGYLEESTLHELLTSNEFAFRDKEWEDFCRVAKDPDTNYIHYEDYVSMLSS